jgi:hypothetical protein
LARRLTKSSSRSVGCHNAHPLGSRQLHGDSGSEGSDARRPTIRSACGVRARRPTWTPYDCPGRISKSEGWTRRRAGSASSPPTRTGGRLASSPFAAIITWVIASRSCKGCNCQDIDKIQKVVSTVPLGGICQLIHSHGT